MHNSIVKYCPVIVYSLSRNEVIPAWAINLSCKGYWFWKNNYPEQCAPGEDGVVALCGPLLLNIVCCSCSPGSRLIVSWVPQRSQLHWNFRVFKKTIIFYYGVILSFGLFWSIGDVNVGMVDRGGQLEVEVNQARGLTPKPGSKNIPGTHFLMKATILWA